MNYLSSYINGLEKLGNWISSQIQEYQTGNIESAEGLDFLQMISAQHALNNWHTEHDLIQQLKHLASILQKENLERWVNHYQRLLKDENEREPVSLYLNANHSFAGIHEWLCCLVSHTPFMLTANPNQFHLLKFLNRKMNEINPSFPDLMLNYETQKQAKYIVYINKQNDSIKSYFAKKKAILLESKPTVALLTGHENEEELYKLGFDIFTNLGQSSRTLRKIFIPAGFDVKRILTAIEPFSFVYRNNKYANNYDYHQSVFLMERISFLDTGFLVVKEDASNDAPTGCLFYEYYSHLEDTVAQLSNNVNIENIICSGALTLKTLKPGTSHFFELWDYPDKQDIIDFLLE